jgi:uncharacterized protein (DUF1015 family)
MAHIEPFRALRYHPGKAPIGQVATQPYDKITPEMQERYYSANTYNFVKIILGKRFAEDTAQNNVYSRAAGLFKAWQAEGVLIRDPEPSLYVYGQQFTAPGSNLQFERRGFIALGKLEDYSAQVVFRHEQTLAKPKADRLDLLRATRAHLEQIFLLYSDPEGEIENALAPTAPPDIELTDEYDVIHRLWRIADARTIDFICSKMKDKKLIIADGHHRYETSLNYRNERRTQAGARDSGDEQSPAPYELTMATFVNMDSPGLLILPTHRVVHGLAGFSTGSFREDASRYFSVEEVDSAVTPGRASAILREAGKTGSALIAVAADRVFLLDRPKAPDSMFSGFSLRQQGLDVVQLHTCILEGVLGISPEAIREQQNLVYLRDAGEAMKKVREGEANIAFVMNPVQIKRIRDIAFSGEVLPQKSTDFYPKMLSGLTVYAME